MLTFARFSTVLLVFVLAVSGVVWTTAGSERASSRREFAKSEAANGMLLAVLARESAFRGYAQARRSSFLEPYDEASASLADAADRARELAEGNDEELRAIRDQQRLADRWAGLANDAIIRLRNRQVVSAESTQIRAGLISRFEQRNTDLRALVASQGAAAHRRSVEEAVLLIILLSAGFACAGGLLLNRLRRREHLRQEARAGYYASQRAFAETLQVTENEAEAHALVKRHLERSLEHAEIVVLNRNNSQNRLEAATPLDPSAPLARMLVDSAPSSCLAVRLGRIHEQAEDNEPLLACGLCAEQRRTTCVPSLVGGEVIGSVLVAHEQPLSSTERARIDESVSQAAPVLANLRNLSIAEVRAATDALTGLPNARALRDSLVRMVAQAARSELPLTAVLCDLDHFKQINDVYGHEKGDQALAAASAAIRAVLRESDLAGRYGGEEFLILLPDTPPEGALVLTERLRDEVALVAVPGVDRAITASFGVATFPLDAPDGEMLVRMADRALYAAKAAGRNCVVGAAELAASS